MAAVNRNMFDASIATDRPGGASLMVLPLNLIAEIVSNVSFPSAHVEDKKKKKLKDTDSACCRRSRTRAILPDYAEHAASSTIWRFRSSIAA